MSAIFADDYYLSRPLNFNGGRLIVICGLDGSGKTTQIEALQNYCESQGYAVCVTKEPTYWYRNDPFVRRYLRNGGDLWHSHSLALFAAADRHRHVYEVIRPALESGKIVICDRYVFSSLAYFKARGVPLEFIEYINRGIPRPDHSFFLDVNVAVLVKRLRERDGTILKFEERSKQKLDELRRAFLSLSNLLTVIDGEQRKEIIAREIIDRICLPRVGNEAQLHSHLG